jgi:hypothetical protein
MQGTTYNWPAIKDAIVSLLFAIISASGWITALVNKKKLRSEIAKNNAETGLAIAQAHSATAQIETSRIGSTVEAADVLLRMMARIEQSDVTYDQLLRETRDWRAKAAEVENLRTQNRLYENQMERAKGDLKSANAEIEYRGFLILYLLEQVCIISQPVKQPDPT